SAEFIKSAVTQEHWLKGDAPEIALIGRSNVGKSSLINTFVNRRGLAKTSSQPGKTRTINFYRINSSFYLVDLPGFGYAKVSMAERRSWEEMAGGYLEQRENLKGVLVILDPRRDATETEVLLYRWIEELGLPSATVFTKADKLSKNKLSSRIAAIRKSIPVGDPVLFSCLTGQGKAALGKRIRAMLSQDAPEPHGS
ncbi:MAG: ribosome biogenesis GTP-binding protein YihA/YsxC, partial [Thermodesulfobacteriota bacterium]